MGALVFAATSCRTAEAVVAVPAKTIQAATSVGKEKPPAAPDPVVIQQNVQRFADEFSAKMNLGIEKLRRGGQPLNPAEVLRWKIAIGTDICAIASGPNAVANLLDLVVLTSVTRAAVEDYAQPENFGDSVLALLADCRSAETEAWRLAATVLDEKQQAELREAIATWRRQNPHAENILAARAVSFATQLAPKEETREKPGSVFGLLRIDPLAGLDPATREIAQSRLLAERALYVTQKMPQLLRWQLELLSLNTLASPTVEQLVTNTTQLTTAVDRVSLVAEQLPAQVDRQREEIFKALDAHEKQLTPLVTEIHQALGAGKGMSDSLNTTIGTMDNLMKRFGVGEPKPAGAAPAAGEPFRILDYNQTAAQLEATARQLTELLRGVDQALGSPNLTRLTAEVSPAVQEAKAGGKEVVDYAFSRGLLLVGAILAAALLYRFVSRRLDPAGRPSSRQP